MRGRTYQARLYVTNFHMNTVTVYSAGPARAAGSVTSLATIAGSNTGLNAPTFLTF